MAYLQTVSKGFELKLEGSITYMVFTNQKSETAEFGTKIRYMCYRVDAGCLSSAAEQV